MSDLGHNTACVLYGFFCALGSAVKHDTIVLFGGGQANDAARSVLFAGRTRFVLHRKYSREIYLIQLYRTQFGWQY